MLALFTFVYVIGAIAYTAQLTDFAATVTASIDCKIFGGLQV